MTEPREPQIFGPIVSSVRPLTAEGDFRLDTIEYYSYRGIFHVQLSSPKIDVTFWFVKWGGGRGIINCIFVEKESRRNHDARSLFSVFNIDIPMTDNDIWFAEDLPENTDTLQELSRISTAIKKHLSEILDLFRPERIEETYRLMLAELKEYREIKNKERRIKRESRFPNFQDNFPLLVILFPALLKLEPQYPKHEEGDFWKRNLGTFKEVLATVGKTFHPRDIRITYRGERDTVDMQFVYSEKGRNLNMFINQDPDNTVAAFILNDPANPAIAVVRDREELVRQDKYLVFPVRNVVRFLGIPYCEMQKGYLADLQELCQLIRNNSPALSEAFSNEKKSGSPENNITRTYNAVMNREGDNDEEIQELMRHYSEENFEKKHRLTEKKDGKNSGDKK